MSRRLRIFAGIAFAGSLLLVLHTLLTSGSWQTRARLRTELASLTSRNHAAEQRIEALEHQIQAMRDRPDVQERVVRQELGLVRADELVIELTPPPQ